MKIRPLSGILLDDDTQLTADDLSMACSRPTAWIIELVDEGVIEPDGPEIEYWRFSATCLQRACVAKRLQRDLGINLAGVAMVLDLLDEIRQLRNRVS